MEYQKGVALMAMLLFNALGVAYERLAQFFKRQRIR